jgi:predicted transcriptional regulator
LKQEELMNALLSIKPEFADLILDGTKKYEYRRRVFGRPVERIFVYASSPHQQIVGEIEVARIHSASPSAIWRKTRGAAGISHSYFIEYFAERREAHAIEVASVTVYDGPVNPYDLFTDFVPPQSYMYVDDDVARKIRGAVVPQNA